MFLQTRDWADDASVLLKTLYLCEGAVELLQRSLFEGHQMLWCDNEATLQLMMQAVLEATAIFNDHVTGKVRALNEKSSQQDSQEGGLPPRPRRAQSGERWNSLRIIADAVRGRARNNASTPLADQWKRRAVKTASLKIVTGAREHDELAQQQFREAYGAKNDVEVSMD